MLQFASLVQRMNEVPAFQYHPAWQIGSGITHMQAAAMYGHAGKRLVAECGAPSGIEGV